MSALFDRMRVIAVAATSAEDMCRAMGAFALAYADQAERDHAALKAAIRKGRIEAFQAD